MSSNEPVNGLGDGDTAPDWVVTGLLAADILAERSGKGSGRRASMEGGRAGMRWSCLLRVT